MLLFSQVLAQITNPAIGNLGNLTTEAFIGGFIRGLISLGLVIGGLAFLFMLIVGGIEWITAGGDKIRTESARRRITNALIGIVVLFSLFAILNFVGCFFGIDFKTINFGPFQVSFGTCRSSGSGNVNDNGGDGGSTNCQPPCTTRYFCSTAGDVSQCCRCVYGNNANGFGPVECCTPPGPSSGNCQTYNVNGCNPAP